MARRYKMNNQRQALPQRPNVRGPVLIIILPKVAIVGEGVICTVMEAANGHNVVSGALIGAAQL